MSTATGLVADISETASFISMLVLLILSLLGIILLLVFRSDGNRLPAPTPQQHRRGRAVATSSLPFLTAIVIQVIYMAYTLKFN